MKLKSRLEQTIYEVDEIESYSSRSCLIGHWSKPVRGKSDGKEDFLTLCGNKFSSCDIVSDHIGKIHWVHNNQRQSKYPDKPNILVVMFAKDRYRDLIF